MNRTSEQSKEFADLIARVSRLEGDEMALLGELVARLEKGRDDYGAWDDSVSRDYNREMREELLDAMIYRTMRAASKIGQ